MTVADCQDNELIQLQIVREFADRCKQTNTRFIRQSYSNKMKKRKAAIFDCYNYQRDEWFSHHFFFYWFLYAFHSKSSVCNVFYYFLSFCICVYHLKLGLTSHQAICIFDLMECLLYYHYFGSSILGVLNYCPADQSHSEFFHWISHHAIKLSLLGL